MNETDQILSRLRDIGKKERARIFREAREISIRRNLKIGDTYLPFIHIPYVINNGIFSRATEKLDILAKALVKMENYALSTEGRPLFDRLMDSLTEGGRWMVRQCDFESHFSLQRRHKRFDAYINPVSGDVSVIEVNQAAPLAIHFHDIIQSISDKLLCEIGFSAPGKRLAPHLLEWFVAEYRERYCSGFPHSIALVIEHGYPPKFTDLPGMAEQIMALSQEIYGEKMTIVTCFPYEISLKSGKIFYGGDIPIDMIWRNSVYMDQYKKEKMEIQDYLSVYGNPKSHLLVNSTRAWLTRNKETFAILWHDDFVRAMGLSEEEWAVIKEIVPESVNLTYDPQRTEDILDEKDHWITKPSDAGFGAGVIIGKNVSKEEWKSIVKDRSSHSGFIFQKRVVYPKDIIHTLVEDGTIVSAEMEFDFCPHHVNGHFTGTALSRANIVKKSGEVDKMNLVSGGHLLPVVTHG